MVINLQGLWHYNVGLNNQDFILKNDNMLLVLDGCSEAIYSEVGTRTFAQYFQTLDNYDEVDYFEENVNIVFEKIIRQAKEWFKDKDKFEEYIQRNYLFTILACFKKKNSFIIKVFGDGYIITHNIFDRVSYIALPYGVVTEKGKQPPYYAYKYCDVDLECIDEYKFKTFIFDTKMFKSVGIATDGIKPIAIGSIKAFDNKIIDGSSDEECKYLLQKNRQKFHDDCTIGILNNGGK